MSDVVDLTGDEPEPSDDRLTEAAVVSPEDHELDIALRPRSLAEFVGQDRVKEQLALLLQAARERGEPVDHLLFSGPPGLGKTTLAQIVAHEMSAGFQPTSGPALERPGDLAAIVKKAMAADMTMTAVNTATAAAAAKSASAAGCLRSPAAAKHRPQSRNFRCFRRALQP